MVGREIEREKRETERLFKRLQRATKANDSYRANGINNKSTKKKENLILFWSIKFY